MADTSRWPRIDSGTVLDPVAGEAGFYAVTGHCGTDHCDDYPLARSAAGSSRWSTTPPRPPGLDEGQVGLAVAGREVLIDYNPPVGGSAPHLLVAPDVRRPFEARLVPDLVGAGVFGLSPEPGGAVWAACPTGMFISYERSRRPAGPYHPVWGYPGTGRGGLVPVTGTVAYRHTAMASSPSEGRVPANTLQRTTDAGRSFTTVGTCPFARNVGTTPRFVFVDTRVGSGVGPTPGEVDRDRVVETTDGGAHWKEVLR